MDLFFVLIIIFFLIAVVRAAVGSRSSRRRKRGLGDARYYGSEPHPASTASQQDAISRLHRAGRETPQPNRPSLYSDRLRVASSVHRQNHLAGLNIAKYGREGTITFENLPPGTDELEILIRNNTAYERELEKLLQFSERE